MYVSLPLHQNTSSLEKTDFPFMWGSMKTITRRKHLEVFVRKTPIFVTLGDERGTVMSHPASAKHPEGHL